MCAGPVLGCKDGGTISLNNDTQPVKQAMNYLLMLSDD